MPDDMTRQRREIVEAARAFSRLGYVHAFGHVSVRRADSILITPTRPPLAVQQPSDVIEVDLDGAVRSGESTARPIEVFLHLGIYAARRDVNAICRTHAPAASLWHGNKHPEVLHGFGGIVGDIAAYAAVDLVHNPELGSDAAHDLGAADALVLRGNGALTVGATLGQAAARMWSLEERCAVALRQGADAAPFSAEELRARQRWFPAEAERVWAWLRYLGGTEALGGAF